MTHGLGGTETERCGNLADIFFPTAPFIVGYMLNNAGLQGVLVYVAQECNKIGDIVDGFAFETVLEEMTGA